MSLQQFFTSRKRYDAETFIGQEGKLFYDEQTGLFRLGDGSTPGGKIVGNLALAAVSVTAPISPFEGELWYNPTTKELWAYYDGSFQGTINLATSSTLGGVRLGPGVITNSEGQIIIDSSGLEFSFGDFSAINNKLSTINPNQDIILLSNGTGAVRSVGEFYIHPTNGEIDDYSSDPFIFGVKSDGQVEIYVPDTDNNAGALEIIGSSAGDIKPPGQPGTMLHITGQANEQSRVYIDGNGNYVSIVGRRWNGNITTGTTQVLAGEDVLRINATAHTDESLPNQSIAQMSFTALENQTTTTQGSSISFVVTPIGQPTANRVTATTITSSGTTSLRFFGPVTGNVTGIATTATDLAAAKNILAGSVSIDPAVVIKSSAAVQTFTVSGLTTTHRVIVTSGTAFGYGLFISAAWVSALNTLSVEFQNVTNKDVDLPAKNLQYFAWI